MKKQTNLIICYSLFYYLLREVRCVVRGEMCGKIKERNQ